MILFNTKRSESQHVPIEVERGLEVSYPPVGVICPGYLHASLTPTREKTARKPPGGSSKAREASLYFFFAASAAPSPKTNSLSSVGRATPAAARRLSFRYFLIAAFRVPKPSVAHLGREATI
jgi:hypothetical protein